MKMKRQVWLFGLFLCFSLPLFLFSCGIEQYYYLPQLSQANIQLVSNNSAIVSIPSIADYYYATNYAIYYRIYISGENIPIIDRSRETLTRLNSSLYSDYNAIFPSTDPTDTSTGTPANTLFKGRNYFELELSGANIRDILSVFGGTLRLEFPAILTADTPASYVILDNGRPITMKRSSELISPVPDYTFNNSTDLSNQANAVANINADVTGTSAVSSQKFAYVSMYIVAVGVNSELFTGIYSKPTHIGIFKLPDR